MTLAPHLILSVFDEEYYNKGCLETAVLLGF